MIALVLVSLLILATVPIHQYTMAQVRVERELEHTERMKALELGRPFPGSQTEAWWNRRLAMIIGAGVPICALALAWLATPVVHPEVSYAIWPAAGAIGVAAVICGTVLAARLPISGRRAGGFEAVDAKPAFDSDALDVVSRRG